MGLLRYLTDFFVSQDKEKLEAQEEELTVSITPPDKMDGAIEKEEPDIDLEKGALRTNTNLSGSAAIIDNTEKLINSYRALAEFPEADNAIQEIVFEAIVTDDKGADIRLDLSDTNFREGTKDLIHKEFKNVLNLLDFNNQGQKLFRRWYIDSRIFFHKILHKDETKGIKELRLLDPRRMQFIREYVRTTDEGVELTTKYNDYFLYKSGTSNDPNKNPYGAYIKPSGVAEIKLPRSMISYAHSGLLDCSDRVIGYLHKAQKPLNQLTMLEDSLVIYRITRAPERRVFYVDVGTMNNKKAQQHITSIMQGMKNRTVYDSKTGRVNTRHNNLSMTEDFWMARRDGKSATEVSSLPGAQSLGTIDDITYHKKKAFESLHIPLSRMPNEGGGVTFSNGGEISRDESKFSKFINLLKTQFKHVFLDPLKTNLVLKNVLTEQEWEENKNTIRVVFGKDQHWEHIQKLQEYTAQFGAVESAREYIGRFVSNEWIQKSILNMSDEDIDLMKQQIVREQDDDIYRDKILDPEEI